MSKTWWSMPKRDKSIPHDFSRGKVKRGDEGRVLHGRRYPWNEWFGAKKFYVRKGRDYNGRTDTFAQQVRTRASERGLSVSVEIDEDGEGLRVVVNGPVINQRPRE